MSDLQQWAGYLICYVNQESLLCWKKFISYSGFVFKFWSLFSFPSLTVKNLFRYLFSLNPSISQFIFNMSYRISFLNSYTLGKILSILLVFFRNSKGVYRPNERVGANKRTRKHSLSNYEWILARSCLLQLARRYAP